MLGVKKVALLFQTGARMPHDALWRLWLESAAGLLPQQALPSLLDAACGPVLEKWLLLLCACYPKRVSGAVAAVQPPWQYLYSLYVHSPPWGTDGYQGGCVGVVGAHGWAASVRPPAAGGVRCAEQSHSAGYGLWRSWLRACRGSVGPGMVGRVPARSTRPAVLPPPRCRLA